MKNPFRRIQPIADWLDDKKATLADRRLRKEYAPQVAEAEKRKDWDKRNELLSSWETDSRDWLEPVYARKAERLAARARKFGITVPPHPSQYGEESDDWYPSQVTGDWLMRRQLEQRLRGEVKAETRASYDEFRKWATLVFAIVGSVLALISIRTKQKEPDPCSRNYYRNDYGECVFALQKNTAQPQPQPAPVGASPPASSQPPNKTGQRKHKTK